MDLQSLPARLDYLRKYLQFLSELPPEEVNEDTDVRQLDNALRARAESCGDEWEDEMDADRAELNNWLQGDPDERAVGFFVLPYLDAFDVGDPTASEIFEKARGTRSGFAVAPPHNGLAIEDHFGRLDLRFANGVIGVVTPTDDSELRFKQQTVEGPGTQPKKEVCNIRLGPWAGKKLVYRQIKPLQIKQVWYFLTDGQTDIVASAFRKNLKDFDESSMETLLTRMTYRGGDQSLGGDSAQGEDGQP